MGSRVLYKSGQRAGTLVERKKEITKMNYDVLKSVMNAIEALKDLPHYVDATDDQVLQFLVSSAGFQGDVCDQLKAEINNISKVVYNS